MAALINQAVIRYFHFGIPGCGIDHHLQVHALAHIKSLVISDAILASRP